MKTTLDNVIRKSLNEILWSNALKEIQNLGPEVKEILASLYPNRQALVTEVKSAVTELVNQLATAAVHRLLGVRFDAFGELDYDVDDKGLETLVSRFQGDVDQQIQQLDLILLVKQKTLACTKMNHYAGESVVEKTGQTERNNSNQGNQAES